MKSPGFEFVACLWGWIVAFCPAPFSNGCHVTSLRIRCSNHNFLLHVILSIPACFYSTWKLIYIQNMISFWLSGRNQYKASQRLKTRYGTGLKMLTTALPISFVYSSSSRKLHRLKCYCVEEMHFPTVCLNLYFHLFTWETGWASHISV